MSRWEPRVSGLVANDYVPKWEEMLGWTSTTKLEVASHLAAWSRVSWMMTMDKAKLRTFLLGVSQVSAGKEAGSAANGLSGEQQKAAMTAAFGKTPVELDQAWRKWVQRTYAHK